MMNEMNDYIRDLIIPAYSKEALSYKKNDFLFREGEEDDSVYFLEEGEVKILKKKWVLWSAKPNELIGISSYFADESTYNFSAKANADCKVYRIQNADFKSILLNNSTFSRAVMDMLCQRIRLTNTRTKSLLEYPSRYRLIHEIIRKAKEIKTNRVPYTLEDLSGVVGVSVRLIRDMISDLEQKKLLERTKEKLIIHDLKGLEIIAKIT
jgi:CRP/FNR family transcriptional regulator